MCNCDCKKRELNDSPGPIDNLPFTCWECPEHGKMAISADGTYKQESQKDRMERVSEEVMAGIPM
tara:strand:- start:1487 stop:1681 length:195 start_codon:yes stop_codon:yes gene_type:complete